ncbi:endolytic transglycosylase MltG [Jatrophihabitans sp. YIM 134969]
MSRHGSGESREDHGYGNAASDLFEPYPEDDFADDDHGHPSGPLPVTRASRRAAKAQARRRRRRRLVLVLGLVVIVGLGFGAYKLSGSLFDFGGSAADYEGQGSGSVTIRIQPGDGAGAIGQTLADADVVESAEAFVAAAQADDRSTDIQPGVYALRRQMSAQSALALLLDPTSRQSVQLVIREGAVQADVERDLATALKVPVAEVQAAAKDVRQIVPDDYLTPKPPTSLEGFLFPATYDFDPGTTPLEALQAIVTRYTTNDREAGLSGSAAKLRLTPYQALTIASIAEAEAKFPGDYAKVARVIMNRLAAKRPLQIDATTIYGAKVAGVDPKTITYSEFVTPYNSYLNAGLTPTPIGNPGEAVMAETAAPPAGNWIYYVNGDAQGHLFFTASEAEFTAAVTRCRDNNWGCA